MHMKLCFNLKLYAYAVWCKRFFLVQKYSKKREYTNDNEYFEQAIGMNAVEKIGQVNKYHVQQKIFSALLDKDRILEIVNKSSNEL